MNQTRRLVNDGGMLKSSLIISDDAGLLKLSHPSLNEENGTQINVTSKSETWSW
jgi:hypothetical protein